MSWIAVAVVGTSAVVGGASAYMSSSAQKDAARIQGRSADNNIAMQWDMFTQQQANQRPFLQAGYGALNQLSTGLRPGGQFNDGAPTRGQLQMDPAYAFRKQEGVNAISAAGAAGGNLGSGNMGVALTRFGQGLASEEYQNAYGRFMNNEDMLFNRLASVAGVGQTAVNNINSAGANTASNVGNVMMNNANNQATARINEGNTWAGYINNVGNTAMGGVMNYYNMQQQQNLLRGNGTSALGVQSLGYGSEPQMRPMAV